MARRLVSWARGIVVALVAASVALVLLARVVNPLLTPLMVLRAAAAVLAGRPVRMERTWVPLEAVSPTLLRAVIAAEDARFFSHRGVDWDAVRRAREWNARHAGRTRGASTITMQCARSTFLWPGRGWGRKAVEVWLATLMELAWSKRRILEVYVNVVEWGEGLYGAEAAAQTYFGRPAARLDARQAALLAAVLPAPLRWSPASPTAYVGRRASLIQHRAAAVELAPLGLHDAGAMASTARLSRRSPSRASRTGRPTAAPPPDRSRTPPRLRAG